MTSSGDDDLVVEFPESGLFAAFLSGDAQIVQMLRLKENADSKERQVGGGTRS